MSKEIRTCEYEHCRVEFEPKRVDQVFCCRRHKEADCKHRKKGVGLTNEKPFLQKTVYFRNPIGGRLTPVSSLGKRFPLEIVYKIIKGGNKGISWEPATDGGIKDLKKQLVFEFNGLVLQYSELDGCDFQFSCLECPRELDKCPDQVNRYSQKTKNDPRKKRVREMSETMTKDEIAKELGVSTKTIQRDLKGGK